MLHGVKIPVTVLRRLFGSKGMMMVTLCVAWIVLTD